jgi:hypothetical protein
MFALIEGLDDGRCLDRTKLDNRYRSVDGTFPAPNYVGCDPIAEALQGFHRGWGHGEKWIGEPARAVHYDIRAVDDTQVDLFVTSDGDLFKWLFDGGVWKYQRPYDLRAEGEFMVLEGGASLVAQREGRWTLFTGFNDDRTQVTPVAEVDGDEPLTVLDDVDNRRSFLLYKDVLYDTEGRSLERLPAGLDSVAKIREVWKAIRRQPPKEQPK